MKTEHSVVIHRPVEEVFAYLSNFENMPNHEQFVVDAKKVTDGAIGVGTQFKVIGKLLIWRPAAILQMTGWESGRRFAFKSLSSPFPVETQYIFEPAAGGTRLTIIDDTHLGGLLRLFEPLLKRYMQRRFSADMKNVKHFLESGRAGVRQAS
ncbi:MAG: hypothetical protein FJZ86_02755 [Chloroflexi bacterium]|nr:hypothetical protein [Chloroflexota bacterium]